MLNLCGSSLINIIFISNQIHVMWLCSGWTQEILVGPRCYARLHKRRWAIVRTHLLTMKRFFFVSSPLFQEKKEPPAQKKNEWRVFNSQPFIWGQGAYSRPRNQNKETMSRSQRHECIYLSHHKNDLSQLEKKRKKKVMIIDGCLPRRVVVWMCSRPRFVFLMSLKTTK